MPRVTKTGRKPQKPGRKTKELPDPRFQATPKNFRIGGDIRPKRRDLTRYVKWPKYVQLQRQRRILNQRLKVPPSIMQFRHTLDKNRAAETFRLFASYAPETRAEKKQRLRSMAEQASKGEEVERSAPPPVVKFGLKHVTTLIEQKKAKIVLIAHDVDPIETVVWLPALCRKMDVPFAIVKGKARLGALVHQKTATCVALTDIAGKDEAKLANLQEYFNEEFNGRVFRQWGGKVMGAKTQAMLAKRKRLADAEASRIANF
jgi:large subunit ribosomal protein L7Ae